MNRGELEKGRHYAARPKGSKRDGPLVKVTYLGVWHNRRAKVRIQSGELSGLDDWFLTTCILCRWGERKALLRDEAAQALLDAADGKVWDRVFEEAISSVFEASGEETGFMRTWVTSPAIATRLWSRAGQPGTALDDQPENYVDRHGMWHLSFETSLKAAQGFAAREPEMVEIYISDWEQRIKAEAREPGEHWRHDLLREWSPGWAVVRAWATEEARSADRKEIERLRLLVRRAEAMLRAAGDESSARSLERALNGG